MPFNLSFPAQNAEVSQLQIESGEMLFVLGANGTGKSSLMHRFFQQNRGQTRKISAHRQTWMNTDALDMTPANKVQTEQQIQAQDAQQQARYRETYAAQRASMTIYEIIDAENVRAREIAAAFDSGNIDAARDVSKVESPITVINHLLRLSNIPITITIRANERLLASKEGGPEYSAAALSDGERNALLIAGNVLTAPNGSLLIIDEPERHLHRSIISPLLSQLFQQRPDCGFVVSTHDHDLPLEVSGARTLLLRSCTFNGENVQSWEADELPADAPIEDVLKRDLLGARRKILFVEGTESSLDKPLYSLIFPMASVIPKGSCSEVERSVVGSRAAEGFHWLRSYGIADGDGFAPEQIEAKRESGVYALPYYSVEAIYFHPQIIQKVAQRQAGVSGDDPAALVSGALAAGVSCIAKETDRLSRKVAKKAVRKQIMDQLPNDDDLMDGQEIKITNNAQIIHETRKAELDAAIEGNDWETILIHCPLKDTRALETISATLRFRKVEDYRKAVRQLLSQDDEALNFVRSLFGDLCGQLNN